MRHVILSVGVFLHMAVSMVGAGPALADDDRVVLHRHELPNGLRVVVKVDRRSPVVSPMLWYRVGSVDEHGGITGISHFLEHLMFKGSGKFRERKGSELIAEVGGHDNAFTSRDYTAYLAKLHREDLGLFMEIEADRMSNLVFDTGEIESERKVVLEEKRLRYDDQPVSKLYMDMFATAFQSSPLRHPVIGWESDINAITVEDLRDWYRTYYSPANAVLVVVGDVDPAEVFGLAERHFGPVGRVDLPARKSLPEAGQAGPRRTELRDIAELPYLFMGYKAPALRQGNLDDADAYALEVLAHVLSGDSAARLSRRLVRERKLAVEAWAGYDMVSRYPGLFMMGGIPSPGHTVEDLAQALREEVADIRENGIDEEELERLKVRLRAGRVFDRDSLGSQARQIGAAEVIGIPYEDYLAFDRRLLEVRAEDVMRVAGKYLADDGLTTGVLIPVKPGEADGEDG